MPSGQPVFNVWLKACRGVMKHILIFCQFCFWWVRLALWWKPKKKFEKSELKATAWQTVLKQRLWFEGAINKINIWGRLHVMQMTIQMHWPSLANRIAKETARVSGIFVKGTRQVTRMRNIRKHLRSKVVAVIAPNSEDRNHYYHYTQPNDKLPSLKSLFLRAKQQSAGCKWNLQPATWFMLNNLSLWNSFAWFGLVCC